jgi:hypothetical protein
MKDDALIGQPANPGADAEVIWVNTEDGTYKDFAGFIGDVLFDEDVTLIVQTWADGGVARTMNGGGEGEVIPAGVPMQVRVQFVGANTLIKLATGGAAPSANGWHANGSLTKGDVGYAGEGVVAYALPVIPAGPAGPQGEAAGGEGSFALLNVDELVVGELGLTCEGAVDCASLITTAPMSIANVGSTGQTAGFTAVGTSGVVAPESTFTGGLGATAYTVGDIVKMLKQAGIAPH